MYICTYIHTLLFNGKKYISRNHNTDLSVGIIFLARQLFLFIMFMRLLFFLLIEKSAQTFPERFLKPLKI